MNSRVRIFSPMGTALGELDVPVFRSWVLNNYGEAEFVISTNDNKAVEDLLDFGNFLYVTHPTLPDWVGVIDTPREWTGNEIKVKAVSAEFITDWRYIPIVAISQGFTPIDKYVEGVLWLINKYYSMGMALNVGQTFNTRLQILPMAGVRLRTLLDKINKQTGTEWDVTGVIGGDNILRLYVNLYDFRGNPTFQILDNSNVAKVNSYIKEEGPIYNHVTVYSQADSGGARNYATAIDEASINQYGLRATAEEQKGGGSDESGLQLAADYLLWTYKQPSSIIAPTVLNVGDTFQNLRLGNIVRWQSPIAGFSGSGIGTQFDARILGMEYDDMTDKVTLVCDLKYNELTRKQFLYQWIANHGRRM